ncbi:dihydrolipoyl dehydrogenase [Desulfobacterales bacterium HSG16]|nr:dihydrolipoyl dehydrogenase [Desulfobacterales bacterium HSG16]
MPQIEKYDLVIIGSGPAGYVASVRASQIGLKTVCIERRTRLGGVYLNDGCIPCKALLDSSSSFYLAKEHYTDFGILSVNMKLDLSVLMTRKEQVVKNLTEDVVDLLEKNKISVIHGNARLAGEDRVLVTSSDGRTEILETKAILLATGSESVCPDGFEFDGEYIVNSTQALSFKTAPKHLVIVGGGYIGLELGSVWNRLGSKVTIIEKEENIATNLDCQISRTLRKILTRQGVEIMLGSHAIDGRVEDGKVVVTIEQKGELTGISCDRLLLAAGRKPFTRGLRLEEIGVMTNPETGHIMVDETFCTSIPTIYAIGDLIPGPVLAGKASAEGSAAVECMAGLSGKVNYDTIPSVIYTWPEIAGIGLTEEDAKEKHIPIHTEIYPFTAQEKTRCVKEDMYVKIISDPETDKIIGIHIIGPRASDMIEECAMEKEAGARAFEIIYALKSNPAFDEMFSKSGSEQDQYSIYTL